MKSSELWGHTIDKMVNGGAQGFLRSDFGRFEYQSMLFYEKHCVEEENKKLKKVFKDQNGEIKHICFIKADTANSVLHQ